MGAGAINLTEFILTLVIQAVTNVLLDMVILGVAVHCIWRQDSSRGLRTRVALAVIIGIMVNMAAIARSGIVGRVIANIRAHYPSDPTHQSAWGITLMTLELNLSVVCASVPTFWTPLQHAVRDRWDAIFVTKEVTVVRTNRYKDLDDEHHPEDERDLTRGPTSRTPSVASEPDVELSVMDRRKSKGAHYEDEFVRQYVNPLREEELVSGTTVETAPRRDSKKWYH